VFRWEHGGTNVALTGTFNGWGRRPMHRSGNDFTYIETLPRGKHAYKFVVDDEWRFAPDQLTAADASGNINNFVDLTGFSPADDLSGGKSNRDAFPELPWGHAVPEEDEFSKDPPLLPPHLRQIILNSGPPDGSANPLELQPPTHTTVNHLYCTAIKGDGLMVQATTQRYRRKHVTTVFYCVMPMSSSAAAAALREGMLPLPAPAPVIAPGLFNPQPLPPSYHAQAATAVAPGAPGVGASSVPASALPLVSASASSVGAQASGAVEALAARVVQAAAASAAYAAQQQLAADAAAATGAAAPPS